MISVFKWSLLIAAAFLSVFAFSGCASSVSGHKEAENIELIRTIGIDKSDGGVLITASTGVGLDESAPEIFQQEGLTITDALYELNKNSVGKEAFFAHTENIIVSEKFAENGIGEVLDYVARSAEIRIVANLYVAKGMDASELMLGIMSESDDITDMLEYIKKDASSLGAGYATTCEDVMKDIKSMGCAMILAVTGEETGEKSNESGKLMAVPSGFGVIKGDKLISYTAQDETHGILSLTGETEYDNITVTDESGGKITLGVTEIKPSFQPVYASNGSLKEIIIKLKTKADVIGAEKYIDISSDSIQKKLAEKASEVIKERAEKALKRSQSLEIDYMNIGWQVEMKAPVKFYRLGSWQKIFPSVKIKTEAESEIMRTFDLLSSIDYLNRGDDDGQGG